MTDAMAPVQRWTPKRKEDLLEAIHGGEITAQEACEAHGISREEMTSWRRRFVLFGRDGLCERKLQSTPR